MEGLALLVLLAIAGGFVWLEWGGRDHRGGRPKHRTRRALESGASPAEWTASIPPYSLPRPARLRLHSSRILPVPTARKVTVLSMPAIDTRRPSADTAAAVPLRCRHARRTSPVLGSRTSVTPSLPTVDARRPPGSKTAATAPPRCRQTRTGAPGPTGAAGRALLMALRTLAREMFPIRCRVAGLTAGSVDG